MNIIEPGATLLSKYRVDRIVAANGDVTVWEATDLRDGSSVHLNVYEHGTTMLDVGKTDSGMYVVIGARRAPRLELVEITDEDAFFDEPPAPELFDVPAPRPRRSWLWWVHA